MTQDSALAFGLLGGSVWYCLAAAGCGFNPATLLLHVLTAVPILMGLALAPVLVMALLRSWFRGR